jgi:hypothetical protein
MTELLELTGAAAERAAMVRPPVPLTPGTGVIEIKHSSDNGSSIHQNHDVH